VCCGVAAQKRVVAAGSYCRQVAGLCARGAVSDSVDASVLLDQRAAVQSLPDLLGRNTRTEELRSRDHAVVGTSDPSQDSLRCVVLLLHSNS